MLREWCGLTLVHLPGRRVQVKRARDCRAQCCWACSVRRNCLAWMHDRQGVACQLRGDAVRLRVWRWVWELEPGREQGREQEQEYGLFPYATGIGHKSKHV